MKSIVVIINGPNLNLLGQREPNIYGDESLEQIKEFTNQESSILYPEVELQWMQSNIEGELINFIQQNQDVAGIVINPAGYTHSSVAIADSMSLLKIPIIEVHLSKVSSREYFRQNRITTASATMSLEGAGKFAYLLGIEYIQLLNKFSER